jgi:hypothetical protein
MDLEADVVVVQRFYDGPQKSRHHGAAQDQHTEPQRLGLQPSRATMVLISNDGVHTWPSMVYTWIRDSNSVTQRRRPAVPYLAVGCSSEPG